MKINPPLCLAASYVVLQWLLFLAALLASDYSYAIWAGAGAASGLMMLFGGLGGIVVLLIGLAAKSQTARNCGAVLLGGCTLPVVLLLVGGGALGL